MPSRLRLSHLFRLELLACVGLLTAACDRQSSPATKVQSSGVAEAPATDDKATDAKATDISTNSYPTARKSDHTDDYHGTKVADPYRWLEDPDSAESRAWIAAENKLTTGFLAEIPQREAIRKRLTKLWDYEKFGVPTLRGEKIFYTHNDGLQNQSVLYTAESLGGPPRELLDPNTLSKDGTVALSGMAISDDGKLLAYGLATAGSDWQEWRVRDVATAKDLSDHLKWIKFSGASWTPDNKGFFYSRYAEPKEKSELTGVNYFQKLYYHKIGTPQSEDRLVYERPDEKEWSFDGTVSEDGHWLVIQIRRGTGEKNQIFYLDLTKPDAKVVELVTGFDAAYTFVGNEGGVFWLHTDSDAERYRLIAVDTAAPDRKQWKEVIPQAEAVLQEVGVVGDRFLANYLIDAHSQAKVFDLTGHFERDLTLPGLGTVLQVSGRREDKDAFYAFASFTSPPSIYRYRMADGETSIFRQPKVDFDPANFETKQIFYKSKDGTRVPMFLVFKKGLSLDGDNPTLLYGYGGFNNPLPPAFSASRIAWLEMGGVYAQANLRGGGEYGRAWHEAGTRERKQNVFDDFIAAAEWLISERYTSTKRLAITGRSNGGLLVGAALTQRPDLFGAALPAVGVMDMLRFHKFTIGWAWVDDYGSSDNAEDFKFLRAYSPLHNIKPGVKYPATLITTADHDDRVVPGHSFKFAATLQAAQAGPAPILIRIETSAGHGAGTPTAKLIDEVADTYAFLVKALGMPGIGSSE